MAFAVALPGQVDHIRPEELERAISGALEQGVSYEQIANDKTVKQATALLFAQFEARQGMYEPGTLRRLKSAWGMFVQYCQQTNQHSLPARPSVVEAYLTARADHRHRNTLNVDAWAISLTHKIAGCPDPTQTQFVKGTLRALVREKIRQEEPIKQAAPFNREALERLTDVWGRSLHLTHIKNLAVMAVAYESMLRESELAAIKIAHLKHENDGGATLTIPNTKTNKSGDPDTCYLSADTMALVKRYHRAAGIHPDGGYLFRAVYRSGKPAALPRHPVTNAEMHYPLAAKNIERVFVKAWLALHPEVDPKREPDYRKTYPVYSGHSARVGATQDLLSAGFDSLQVQQSGRWKSSTMVAQYGRNIGARKSAMAIYQAQKNKEDK